MQPDTLHAANLFPALRDSAFRVPRSLLPPLLLILAGVLAYWNSFDGVFVYDDIHSIRDNPHIRVLWPPSESMSLPLWSTGETLDGRPLLSLTFALNHALLGPEPWGYHLVNLLIHLAAALLLFGIVRRTLDLPQFRERYAGSLSKNQGFTAVQAAREDARPPVPKRSRKFGGRASSRAENLGQSPGAGTWLALAVALIWSVHPLQTESVTYIVQRAESLMGFFYLLTLCCAIRGFRAQPARGDARPPQKNQARGVTTGGRASPRAECGAEKRTSDAEYRISNIWYLIAILACALGMGVKQTMFSAPLLVLLYDGVFVSDSIRTALQKRWRFYACLFSTWLIVFGIIAATWRESTIDFVKISPVRYLLTQPLVLLYYLRLAIWPDPLVLSYGWQLEDHWPRIVFPGLVIAGLLAVMFRGVWRRKWYGFVLAWFFLILAPTSSIAPMRQAIFEHRMYLSLAAAVVLVVIGAEYAIRRLCLALGAAKPRSPFVASFVVSFVDKCPVIVGVLALAVTLAFGCLTHARNRDYYSALGIWQDNVVHRPQSHFAHNNAALYLRGMGRLDEAVVHLRAALSIHPDHTEALNNFGNVLLELGRPSEAIPKYRTALRISPRNTEARYNWGVALDALGRPQEAIPHYREALQIEPGLVVAHFRLGNALVALGHQRQAVSHYRQAVELMPDFARAHNNLGNILLELGRPMEALPHCREALRIRPGFGEARFNLGNALLMLDRPREAIDHYRKAVQLNPDHAEAHNNLSIALRDVGMIDEAITHGKEAVRLDPDNAGSHNSLGVAYRAAGRPADAIRHFEEALRLKPDYAAARKNLRETREMSGKRGSAED